MKKQLLILSAVLTIAVHASFGQANTPDASQEKLVFKPTPICGPLYILKSDERTMELDPRRNEIFDIKAIDSKYVKMITTLSSEDAKRTYGEKGSNGVIVVQLVDNYILTKAPFIKFKKED